MGKPLPPSANPATPTPPQGDLANAVVQGTLAATGAVSQPFCIYGAFNVEVWGSITATLATQAGVATATITTAGLAAAAAANINSTIVPPGTNIVSSPTTFQVTGVNTVTLGGLTTAQVSGLTATSDAAAIISGVGITPEAVVQLERSFDGGSTWLACGVGGGGQPARYTLGAAAFTNPISLVVAEPERGVAYRLHCVSLTANTGTLNYRISASGLAAMTWGIPIG